MSLLSVITYLDRVCISVAGPRMQEALHIGPVGWGWVTGMFTLAYAIFEIPGGSLGDRIGPRLVLTRIVLWWSAFTSLTGMVSNFYLLLLTRFCFGAGEAGAYPNVGISIARWFPLRKRTGAWGIVLMAGQIGGAIAPLLVVPIQIRYGWRASFFLFGVLGVAWAMVWYFWYRDSPAEMPAVSAEEAAETSVHVALPHGLPWSQGVRSANLWAVMAMAASAGYTSSFFQTWLGTYLVKARGFTETGLLLASLPFFVGACANACGGFAGDLLVRKLGLTWGRRSIGMLGFGSAALFVLAAMLTGQKTLAVVFLSLAYGGFATGQPALMVVCLDIGGKYSGAVTGAMNMAAYMGAFFSSIAYGYIAKSYGYNAPFIPMIGLMMVAALLWLKVEPERHVVLE